MPWLCDEQKQNEQILKVRMRYVRTQKDSQP